MNDRPHPPYDDYRAALGEHPEGHAALDDLHAAMHADDLQAERVEASARRLRALPQIEASVANWFEAPRTQNWLKILADAGL